MKRLMNNILDILVKNGEMVDITIDNSKNTYFGRIIKRYEMFLVQMLNNNLSQHVSFKEDTVRDISIPSASGFNETVVITLIN